jgi:hypothetical protein
MLFKCNFFLISTKMQAQQQEHSRRIIDHWIHGSVKTIQRHFKSGPKRYDVYSPIYMNSSIVIDRVDYGTQVDRGLFVKSPIPKGTLLFMETNQDIYRYATNDIKIRVQQRQVQLNQESRIPLRKDQETKDQVRKKFTSIYGLVGVPELGILPLFFPITSFMNHDIRQSNIIILPPMSMIFALFSTGQVREKITIMVLASKDLEPGEQLFWDYAHGYAHSQQAYAHAVHDLPVTLRIPPTTFVQSFQRLRQLGTFPLYSRLESITDQLIQKGSRSITLPDLKRYGIMEIIQKLIPKWRAYYGDDRIPQFLLYILMTLYKVGEDSVRTMLQQTFFSPSSTYYPVSHPSFWTLVKLLHVKNETEI